MAEENLAVKYLEYIELRDSGTTFNDFFDWVGVPMENRTDFAVAAILKNAREIIIAQ
jgi:hypothetical protein